MGNVINNIVKKMKKEIREEANILYSNGYTVKVCNCRVGEVLCLRLIINGKAICVSCEKGVLGNLMSIRDSLNVLERFVTDVA